MLCCDEIKLALAIVTYYDLVIVSEALAAEPPIGRLMRLDAEAARGITTTCARQ